MPVTLVLSSDVVDTDVALHQQVVGGRSSWCGCDAQPHRQRALRVEVDQQHPPAELGQRGAEVDRRGRLADAALLVAERDDAGRTVPVQRWARVVSQLGPSRIRVRAGSADLDRCSLAQASCYFGRPESSYACPTCPSLTSSATAATLPHADRPDDARPAVTAAACARVRAAYTSRRPSTVTSV